MGNYAEHVLPRIVNVARWHEIGRPAPKRTSMSCVRSTTRASRPVENAPLTPRMEASRILRRRRRRMTNNKGSRTR